MDTATISAAFPFTANYVEVHGSKMHYVDEGSGDPILFLHGNPTSSYLWRNVIPHLSGLGRCIAPDLMGMGKSDKPAIEYRFMDHVKYLDAFIEALDLQNITLVIHDWGSGLGFYYAARYPKKVKGIAFMEALLMPVPSYEAMGASAELFQMFRHPEMGRKMIIDDNGFIEQILPQAVVRDLTEEEMNHYRAPYLEPASREPLFRFPNEIPIGGEPADVHEAAVQYHEWLKQTELPLLMFAVTPGAIMLAPIVNWAKATLKNVQTIELGKGIHFVQEDHPHAIGQAIAEWYQTL